MPFRSSLSSAYRSALARKAIPRRFADVVLISVGFVWAVLLFGAVTAGCSDPGRGGVPVSKTPCDAGIVPFQTPNTLEEALGDINAQGVPETGTITELTADDEILFVDGLGSLTQVTDTTGKPRGEFVALPYGEARLDDTQENRRFAGGTRDPGVGLDLIGARNYAADLGQWVSVDPMLVESPERMVGAHPSQTAYSYANSNPVARVDPDGHHPVIALGLAAAAFVGVMVAAEYANTPTEPRAPLYHEGAGEIALQSAENFGAIVALANAPRAVACISGVAMTGNTLTVLGTAGSLVAGTALHSAAGTAADHFDPSGVARRVINVATDFASWLMTFCFASGTPVVMCDGTVRAIDQLVAGDLVVSRDVETGVTDCRAVESTVTHDDAEIVELRFADEAGHETVLQTTQEHPFWVEGTGWVLAGDMALGTEVVSASGTRIWLASEILLAERQRVFNLHVDQFHSYFVGGGDDAILVHNGWCSEPKEITLSRGRYPESAKHIEDAQAAGHPSTLTIDRAGAAAQRRQSLAGTKVVPGMDRDEYPPAMFQEGGHGASVRPVTPGDNRGAGASLGAQCRGLPNGAKVEVKVTE